MNDFRVHPLHFLIPVPLVIVGGLFTLWQRMAWVGYSIVALAVILLAWLIWRARKDHELALIDKEMEQQDKEMEFHKMILAASPEDRAILGWKNPVTELTVKVDKTAREENELSLSYSTPPIEPWRMQTFAMGVLAGKGLGIRTWAPKSENKLLSDPEWRKLMDWLKKPVEHDPTITFVQPINPNNVQDGLEMNELGMDMMEMLAQDNVLARLRNKHSK